ncbi:glycosyltransferase family 4 protein [Robertkochia sediminum]|uniref:glycosyltransferase family 4 protein n=1 Tax=Robertkochia sediminum TaxID=2785326 RepID=UPI001933B1C1|nr:glycosyltransferase family 4 protein [Robertkochia sediminum]MBL7473603.1 glycosyltransferase family 4 protein [Robertkochia sediminum]
MKKIFVIGYVWPEPTASAAGVRMLQLIRFFREREWEVHFGTPAQHTEHAYDLRKMGVTVHDIRINDDGFNDFIASLAPDAVLFDRYMMEEQFAWRVAEHCPSALRILDTEDLHFLRKHRKFTVKKGLPFKVEDLLADDLAKREVAAIYRCDLSLVVSEMEMEVLTELFHVPSGLLVYHPVFAEDKSLDTRNDLPGFHERSDVMFIGNFLHEPNADAVRVLENDLWPEISKKLPGVKLHIYGAYMPKHYKERGVTPKGICFHGRAPEVDVVMRNSRILLAPLRFGAGIKGKLIRGFENGLPSVTTAIGAEGIAGALEWGGSVVAPDSGFVEAVADLYHDEVAWDQAAERGFRIIDARFQRASFEKKLDARINALLLDIEFHRRNNFTGQMLMDQRNMAARYLSKYIVAKNRS